MTPAPVTAPVAPATLSSFSTQSTVIHNTPPGPVCKRCSNYVGGDIGTGSNDPGQVTVRYGVPIQDRVWSRVGAWLESTASCASS